MSADVLAPTTPQYLALKPVYDKWITAKQVREQAQADEDALYLEVYSLAKAIRQQNVTDENYTLAPTFCEGKSIEKVDADLIRKNHPDIYDRSNPHISKNGMGTMLQSIHTSAELQQMFRDMNREQWYELSSITKADLKKAVSATEWQMLESEGAIVTEVRFDGEIKLVCRKFQETLDAQRARFLPHTNPAPGEEDE